MRFFYVILVAILSNEVIFLSEIKRFACTTSCGDILDRHFGHADEFYIYGTDGINVTFIEKRSTVPFCDFGEDSTPFDEKVKSMLSALRDCCGVLTLMIGNKPASILAQHGIKCYIASGRITELILDAASGKLPAK